jgi:hypothetical protein
MQIMFICIKTGGKGTNNMICKYFYSNRSIYEHLYNKNNKQTVLKKTFNNSDLQYLINFIALDAHHCMGYNSLTKT